MLGIGAATTDALLIYFSEPRDGWELRSLKPAAGDLPLLSDNPVRGWISRWPMGIDLCRDSGSGYANS